MKDSDILLAAAQLIEEKGWVQRYLQTEDGYCLIGSVLHSLGGRYILPTVNGAARWHSSLHWLYEHLHLSVGMLSLWNDDKKRTKEEVLTALREAAKMAQEHGE